MQIRDIKSVVIAGAGIMGSSLAQIFAGRGMAVALYDLAEEALERSRELIGINQRELVAGGMVTQAESDRCRALITHTLEKACFAGADFIIETIVERMEAKHAFFREICAIAPAGAVLTSNTSGLSITEIAVAVAGPERFCGMHWVNPPHIVPLVEVIRHETTADATVSLVRDLALHLGKEPVLLQRDAPGFLLNRIQFAVLREAMHIVESGIAAVEDVDTVLKYGLGMRYAAIGPFETADLGGLDTFHSIASYLFADLSDAKEPQAMLGKLVEGGNHGVKSGRGFYDYGGGRGEEAIRRRDRLFLELARVLYGE